MKAPIHTVLILCATILAGCDHSWRHQYIVDNRSDYPLVVEYRAFPDVIRGNMGREDHDARGPWTRAEIAPRSEQMFHYISQFLGSPQRDHRFPIRIYCDSALIYEQENLTGKQWSFEDYFLRTEYTLRVFDIRDPRRAGYRRDAARNGWRE